VEVDLLDRLGAGFRAYASAKRRAEMYKSNLIPRAEESFKLLSDSVKVKGAPFEFLQVYQAQRAMTEARLEYVKSLAEAWRAAGELSGLLLEEQWPPKP
jgi:cobalt-zinc-cadmium efflux system outer membrane protein